MTKVVDLSPRVVAPRLIEQCEMPSHREFVHPFAKEKHDQRLRDKGFNPDFCARHVRYEIDGKRYCPLHAGQVALDLLMKQQTGN